jgi:hypothetical protein
VTVALPPGPHQELLYPVGRRGPEARRVSGGHLPHVFGVEAIHVLAGIDAQQYPAGIDMLGKRQLDQNAVDLGIRVQAVHQGQEVGLTQLRRPGDRLVIETGFVTRLPFHADVRRRGRILAHQHGGQPRGHSPLLERRDLGAQLRPHRLADGRSVDDLSVQSRSPSFPG